MHCRTQCARGSYLDADRMALLSRLFRLCFRFAWLSVELLLAAFVYIPAVALRSAECRIRLRAHWLQKSCRRVLRVLNVEVDAHSPVPTSGLLVCNHLSYLDVLVLGSLTPAVFVAKREVKHWPVFGWFAALAGTIFVDRERRTQTGRAAEQIEAVLEGGQLIVLFPEGTSSDGKTVLPFKSSLLAPATKRTRPLSAGALRYNIEHGDVAEEVCYWKDMTFFPHLLNLLTKDHILSRVCVLKVEGATACRKALARQLQSEVSQLNATFSRMGTSRARAPMTSTCVLRLGIRQGRSKSAAQG
jgi:1-acyl-sn-glycerol-3-phosphate acyltransferase